MSYTILHRSYLLRTLRRDIDSKPTIFSSGQVDAYAAKLANAANVTTEQKQAHAASVRERTSGTTCPYCNAQLVRRNGKYGEFWGCSSYPKCKFIRK
jgi:Zn-finger domain associated with topoisomerase type I